MCPSQNKKGTGTVFLTHRLCVVFSTTLYLYSYYRPSWLKLEHIILQLSNCSGLGLECHGFGLAVCGIGLVVYGLGLCGLVNMPVLNSHSQSKYSKIYLH